jgi:hypothetical protein
MAMSGSPPGAVWQRPDLVGAFLTERQTLMPLLEEVECDLVDDGDEDRPDRAEDQVQWLQAAGFDGAEVHFKWAEAAIFGAVKPGGASE